MIKRIIPLVALMLSGAAFAQIGIGTKKAASAAQLDVVASNKGVLLPRLTLNGITDRTSIEGELVESLLVYHLGIPTMEAGFYYWKDNSWTALLSGTTFVDRKNNTFVIGVDSNTNEESLIITDTQGHSVSLAVKDIANNTTFVTNLAENKEFVTKLGDNIDFVNNITENTEFVENIYNELKGRYGNVSYDKDNNKFTYFDGEGVKQDIEWSELNTTNQSFTLTGDQLVITDSDNNTVALDVAEIANNATFVTNLAENKEFVTKLGDNIEFVNNITENTEFVENIYNELKGRYGNVSYDKDNNKFTYFDGEGVKQDIEWSELNTTNQSFTLTGDQLVITDSDNNTVALDVAEIANNATFVTNLAENKEFVTKLGDNIEFVNNITENTEFVENIYNELKGRYGNVSYDKDNNKFTYFDGEGVKQDIEWSELNTTNQSFTLTGDQLVITDSDNNTVALDVAEIANNATFVTNLAENKEFVTKLGDNIDFVNNITENTEFVENIYNELKGRYGNVSYDKDNNKFTYFDGEGVKQDIEWSELNTTNQSFTLTGDQLVITDSDNNTVALDVAEIANNATFVTNLAENKEFVTKLGDNIDFVNNITENTEFVENIYNELKGRYGNVSYDKDNNKFTYFDVEGVKQDIEWSELNTTNQSFTLTGDQLVITDSDNNTVALDVAEIANNATFVTNLAENKEFVTKLGDNIDFVNNITENTEFVENIYNELKGRYGNVSYDKDNNKFTYFDGEGVKQDIEWSELNTTNQSFTLAGDQLVITDSDNNTVALDVAEIANNATFVTNLAENKEFVTKLGDNIDFVNNITENTEFVENIYNELKGRYGNVSYDKDNNKFTYFDGEGVKQDIEWSELNTTNQSFTLAGDQLIITDSDNNTVALDVAEIANNATFVQNLAKNNEFVTQLGNNEVFKTIVNAATSAAIVDYTYDETIKEEKWLGTDKKIAQRVWDITLAEKTNEVLINALLNDVILQVRLINKETNAINEGIVSKEIIGNQTLITIGVANSLTTVYPEGSYYLIVEYIK